MYTVVVLDTDKCELSSTPEDTFKTAKEHGIGLSKDRELIRSGAHKVEVRDSKGECVWDRFMVMSADALIRLETVRAS
jgi:hypothetical protein